MDANRRKTPEASATLKERHDLRSARGKRGTRPVLGFRLAVLQHSRNDEDMTVNSMLDHNKLVNDAKRDTFDVIYYPTDVGPKVL